MTHPALVPPTPRPSARPRALAEFPAEVRGYLEEVVALAEARAPECISAIVYGSATVGGYSSPVSDIDVMLILSDDAGIATRRRIERDLVDLEDRLGVGWRAVKVRGRLRNAVHGDLKVFVSNFVCPRSAFLAGDAYIIFGVSRAKSALISRIIFGNILASSVTIWGEDLLPVVQTPDATRLDLLKAFWSVWSILMFAVLAFPWTRSATRYAMAALKKSVHNCYFCYRQPVTTLANKLAYLRGRAPLLGRLSRLLDLRERYEPSFRFIASCVWMIPYMHYRAARDNRFPIPVRATTHDRR